MILLRFLLFFFLLSTPEVMARKVNLERDIKQIELANSKERIRLFCIFFDDHIHSKTPEKLDAVLKVCYRLAERDHDKTFKSYLDFYRRARAVMLIQEDERYARKAKMLKIWKKSLAYYKSVGDERFIALSRAYAAHIFFMRKDYANSIEYWLKAKEEFRKVGYEHFPDIGKHLHNMSLVFYFFRDYKTVAELMEVSVRLSGYGSNYDIQRFNTLGASYSHLKQYDKAEKAFLKTIETATFYNDSLWIAIASKGLAKLYLDMRKYNEALALFETTIATVKEKNEAANNAFSREFSEHLLGLARTNILLKEPAKARYFLRQINYKKIDNPKERLFMFGTTYQDINYWLDFYDVQYRYYYAVKDYKNACYYADSLYAMKYKIDSVFNGLEVQVAAHHLEAQEKQYLSQSKEATIQSKNSQMFLIGGLLAVIAIASILLYRKNLQVRLQNKIINNQLDELGNTLTQKQVLFSELQHRVKNNLQHVISILELQKESVDFNSIDELIRGNQNRIHSMALLHKKLNVADHVNEVEIKRYICELSELVKGSYDSYKKKISLKLNCEVAYLSIEKALPIGLIVVELVSNSMKHAFKNQDFGVIGIEFTKEQHGMTLHYFDDGKGFDFDKTNEKGLGQEIIKGLIDQLDGAVETKSNNGFDLKIYFE